MGSAQACHHPSCLLLHHHHLLQWTGDASPFRTHCRLSTALMQGTSLVLGPLNYLFVHTFNSGKYCLGVFDNGRAGGLIL